MFVWTSAAVDLTPHVAVKAEHLIAGRVIVLFQPLIELCAKSFTPPLLFRAAVNVVNGQESGFSLSAARTCCASVGQQHLSFDFAVASPLSFARRLRVGVVALKGRGVYLVSIFRAVPRGLLPYLVSIARIVITLLSKLLFTSAAIVFLVVFAFERAASRAVIAGIGSGTFLTFRVAFARYFRAKAEMFKGLHLVTRGA